MSRNSFVYFGLGLFVYLFILVEFFHPITAFNQDLGRHLLLGKIILTTHSVPKTNLLSYTYPNFPFINSHWLSEVVLYSLSQSVGLPGLLFIMSSLAALSVVITIMTVSLSFRTRSAGEKSPGRSLLTLFVEMTIPVLLASGILLERTDLRPEIFSFFFISAFMVILWNYHNSIKGSVVSIKGSKASLPLYFILTPKYLLFLLPLLEVAWVNMHIYFIIGPLLIFLFFLDSIWLYFRSEKSKLKTQNSKIYEIRNTKYVILFLVLVLVLTSLATLANPNFIKGALLPFTVLQQYGYTIAENQSIFFLLNYGFRHWSYLFFGMGVILLFGLLLVKRKYTRPIDWLLAITFTGIAASAIRNLPLFVFATMPTIVYLIHPIRTVILGNPAQRDDSRIKRHPDSGRTPLASMTIGRDDTPSLGSFVSFGSLFLLICIFEYLFISENGLGYGIAGGAENGVNFFVQNHLKGPIFNNFDIGSYLAYRLYPKEKVFVDGRPEAYPVIFFQNMYIPMQTDTDVFNKVQDYYHLNTIFFSYTDQTPWAKEFFQKIMQNPQWQLVYLDTFSAIWVKNNNLNQPIIKHFGITQDNFTAPNDSRLASRRSGLTTNDYTHLLYFLDLIGWQQEEIPVAQKMLALDATNCTALNILAQNPSTTLLYQQRYLSMCK